MLRPQDNISRETKRLDGFWEFTPDEQGRGREQRWWESALPASVPMPVPSSYNDISVGRTLKDHVGDVWYQRTAFVPRGWDGQRIMLRLDAATHRATVWVNDTQVAQHEGGYTPFEADVTEFVNPGTSVRITVAVNNELSWQSLPPGIVNELPDGRRRQMQFHDFFNYAGLHRTVWLYSIPIRHIADVTVVTDVEEAGVGIVRCVTTVESPIQEEILLELCDAAGEMVAEARGSEVELRVPDVHLWQPGDGYLYQLQITLIDADSDSAVDHYVLPVGVRTVRIERTQFLINNEPFYFKGFGKHEDLNVHGRGHDDAALAHDFALLEWIGANSIRTSHYPYAEEVLELADRQGVVVIDETAAVGLNLGIVGGFLAGISMPTYSEETINSATQLVHQRAIEELIAREKNHPCVVLWSLANEPESNTEAARDYFAPLFAAAREADPTRPVGFANMMLAGPNDCTVTELADVVMVNRYYGWYTNTGDLVSAELGLEQELLDWSQLGKPILVTEYGADAIRASTTLMRPSGARSTKWTCSRSHIGSSSVSTLWWASRCGTSPILRPGHNRSS